MAFMLINKYLKRITLTLCVILFSLNLDAQRAYSVIPYEMYSGKMIVNLKINGKTERLIFDTGAAKSTLSSEYCRENNIEASSTMKLTDVTSTVATYPMTMISSIATLDNQFTFVSVPAVIMPEPSPLRCFNVVGLVGSDILAKTICTIDSKSKTITISTPEKPSPEPIRFALNLDQKSVLPVFNVLVNGVDITVLFDTGSGSFMNLKDIDFEQLKEHDAVQIMNRGSGAKSFGLANKVESSNANQVYIKNLRVGPAKFADIFTETSNSPHTLLGVKIMEYAKITIDYTRKRLYCIPYQQDTIRPLFKEPNFGLTIRDGKLIVSNVWKEHENLISEGDIITHINGVPTRTYQFCDIIGGVKEMYVPGPKILTIQTKDGNTLDLEYKIEILKL